MELNNFVYLNTVSVAFLVTLFFCFKKPLKFYTDFKHFIPALIFTGAIFIIWNVRFEQLEIWKHNPEYISGIHLNKLPIESLVILLTISVFPVIIYKWVKTRFGTSGKQNIYVVLNLFLLIVFGLITWFFRVKLYTFFTFFLLTIYLGYTVFRNRFRQNFQPFYIAFLVSLLPFFLLKLLPVQLSAVNYHELHILGIRLAGIPIEDFAYLLLLMLINITIYEYLKERHQNQNF